MTRRPPRTAPLCRPCLELKQLLRGVLIMLPLLSQASLTTRASTEQTRTSWLDQPEKSQRPATPPRQRLNEWMWMQQPRSSRQLRGFAGAAERRGSRALASRVTNQVALAAMMMTRWHLFAKKSAHFGFELQGVARATWSGARLFAGSACLLIAICCRRRSGPT